MKFVGLGAIVALGAAMTGGPVEAADLGRPAPPPSVETYYGPAAYNWSGFYAGGFVGLAHGLWTVDFYRNNNHGHAEEGADGFVGGAWAGYNFQAINNVVYGVEADLGRTNAKQYNNIFDNDTSLAQYGTIGSVRGRLGFAMERLLVYGTAGVAFGTVTNDIQKGRNAGEEIVWDNQTRVGYAVGAGAEYALSERWRGRIEYIYSNLGSETLYNRDGNRADLQNELHQLRMGVSYRF